MIIHQQLREDFILFLYQNERVVFRALQYKRRVPLAAILLFAVFNGLLKRSRIVSLFVCIAFVTRF